MVKRIPPNIGFWLAILLVGFGIVVFVYIAVQQNYRMSANDPQIQMAEDAVVQLAQGKVSSSIGPVGSVDISRSLAPFEIIIDKQLKIVATNANQSGSVVPLPPVGVFTDASSKGELRFTWQTAAGQRFATVVDPAPSGFVITARSLKEVEQRQQQLFLMATATLACIVIAVGALYFISEPHKVTSQNRHPQKATLPQRY